ncbi:hypothetical protein FACS1894187_05540 [Synergistales bacterium]|nr:hypothetical protein FACS1894187_05540 [Synergistales bacterium]
MRMRQGETVQITARINTEIYRKLRFLAADKDMSINEALNFFLQEAMAGHHISVPIDLLIPEQPQ